MVSISVSSNRDIKIDNIILIYFGGKTGTCIIQKLTIDSNVLECLVGNHVPDKASC